MPRPSRVAAAVLLPWLVFPATAQADRPPEAFQVALGLQQRGLHDEAVRYLEQFLKAAPQHALAAEAHYRLGQSRQELGQPGPAVAALQQALQLGGERFRLRVECRYRLGGLLQQQGEAKAARQQFQALVEELPADHYLRAATCFQLGEAARDSGDDAAALAAFAQAAAVPGNEQPYRFPGHYQRGFAALRLQQPAVAAEAFAAALAVAPDPAAVAECHYLIGDAKLRAGDAAGAEAAFAKAAALPSEFADDAALGRAFAAVQRGDREAVRDRLRAFLSQHGDSPLRPRAALELGRVLYQLQQFGPAQAALQELLAGAVDPALQQQARELAGLCALGSGDGQAALAALQQAHAAAADADRLRLAFALGEAHSNLGQWPAALAAYAEVGDAAEPGLRGDAAYGACFALHQLQRHDESTAQAQRVLALTPPHRLAGAAAFAIAENHFAKRDYAAAAAAYAALPATGEHGPQAAWKLAWCSYLQGDHAGAAPRFAAVHTGGGPFAEEALAMQALALLEAGDADGALAAADRYRARHRDGAFLDRTERVAARVLQKRGELAAAAQRLERAAAAAAARQQDAGADQLERAELAFQQGDFAAAASQFAALAERQDPIGAKAQAGAAWCAFELGDLPACAARLATARQHPAAGDELPGLLELQVALHHRQQEWPPAIAAAQDFLSRFPAHPRAPHLRFALGTAEARAGDHAAARRTLQLLQQDGNHPAPDRVAYELAWASRRAGDEPAALRAFDAVVARSEDQELRGEALLHLGAAAIEAKDLTRAAELLHKVQGRHRGRALYRLGTAEFAAAGTDPQRLAVARGRFTALAALPDEPLAAEGLYFGAECCLLLQDAPGALERLQALLQQHPGHDRADRARLLCGEAAVAADRADAALAPLTEFLAVEGRDRTERARAHLALGRARARRGEHAAAEASLQQVTELSDGRLAAEAQFRLGECREQRGDLPAAIDAFVKLPILYAEAEWVRRGLLQAGLGYLRLEQPDKAQRFFRELSEKHPDSAEAATARQHLGTPRDGGPR